MRKQLTFNLIKHHWEQEISWCHVILSFVFQRCKLHETMLPKRQSFICFHINDIFLLKHTHKKENMQKDGCTCRPTLKLQRILHLVLINVYIFVGSHNKRLPGITAINGMVLINDIQGVFRLHWEHVLTRLSQINGLLSPKAVLASHALLLAIWSAPPHLPALLLAGLLLSQIQLVNSR